MIYVTGDMHGELERLYDREIRKVKRGDVLIVCGDFGYIFDGSKNERAVVNYLAERKFTTAFVDGQRCLVIPMDEDEEARINGETKVF